ncbi:MAG: glycosyltransferase family 39 protein [Clostridia bacterium]|nr:glycosyltransferase family 39 protein [Clostridia bacterium]
MAFGYFISLLFLGAYYSLDYYLRTKNGKFLLVPQKSNADFFPFLMIILVLVRLIVAAKTDGHSTDMVCWAAWGNRMNEVPLSAFYAPDYFCDYPPGYLYILGAVSKLSSLLNITGDGYYFMLKLPPILADIVIALLLYRYASPRMSKKGAGLFAVLYMLSPVFFYDSAVWGQIESVLLVFLLLSLLLFQEKKYAPATVLYALSILIKPQGILLAPVILLLLLESKDIKKILVSFLLAYAAFLIVIIPFSPAWQNETGFKLFLELLNPFWMIDKYLTTLGSYPYFSVNAFNFYAFLNLNWAPLSNLGSEFLASSMNYIILALGVLGSFFLYFKIKDKSSNLWISCYFLFGFLFTFAVQMHERYIVLSIIFLLLAYLTSKNKHLLRLFAGFSCAGFLNLFCILILMRQDNTFPDYALVLPIAFLVVLLFGYSVWVIYRFFLKDQPKDAEPEKEAVPLFQKKKTKKFSASVRRKSWMPQTEDNLANRKMVRLDYLILAGIVLVYSVIAYVNLGDTVAPQTYYKPATNNDCVTITLANTETVSEINYYCGIGSVGTSTGMKLQYSEDGINWTEYPSLVCTLNSVFCWHKTTLDTPIRAKMLRLYATTTDYMLFEAGFRNANGELLSIASVTQNGFHAFDESNTVTNKPSYENGTYFDEIYHPRTAFEHLHLLPYYETTHPPLGKLIMSVGIAIFGMTPFGWRFMGTLVGILMLPLLYLLLKQLFGRTRYATVGTLLFAYDFMHFSLTRLATIDSYPVLFIIGMYYFMYLFAVRGFAYAKGESVSTKQLMIPLLLSGIFMGLGCASKWTAVYAAAGLAVEFFVILAIMHSAYSGKSLNQYWDFTQNICMWCLLFFVAIPACIYTFSYLPISMVDGYGNVFEAMWKNQDYMFNYHSTLQADHPYSSPWYTWPFVKKPMWAYMAPKASIPDGTIGCISIFQNPVLSWAGVAAFFYSLYIGWKKKDFRVLFLFIGLMAQYLPWILISRTAFQYHFFASMLFLILFIMYAIQDLEQRFPRFKYVTVAFTVICIALFVMFYPVISGVPASREYVDTFLRWFDSWVFFV